MPSYNRCNTRSKIAMFVPIWKTNTRQQALSFFGTKIWPKTSHSIKNVSITASFTVALSR